MRQFFSWRIWAAFGALAGLAMLLAAAVPSKNTVVSGSTDVMTREIDFISFVFLVQPSGDFGISDGVVSGRADLVIDGQRTMHIVEGTLGSNDCQNFEEVGQCVVFADLLGEAVVWFALVPFEPGLRVVAPPIADLLDDGIVQLDNGWLLRASNQVERKCPQETGSLSEFIARFGPDSSTIVDVAKQRITAVVCSPKVTTNT